MPVNLTDEMREFIDHAADKGTPCIFVTVSREGYPNPSFRGSMMVFDGQHLAYWDRSRRGALSHMETNPKVAMIFRDPPSRTAWRFYGTAILHPEGAIREQVMSRTPQRELDADPDRKGVAVLILVDRVTDNRGQVLMEREQ